MQIYIRENYIFHPLTVCSLGCRNTFIGIKSSISGSDRGERGKWQPFIPGLLAGRLGLSQTRARKTKTVLRQKHLITLISLSLPCWPRNQVAAILRR